MTHIHALSRLVLFFAAIGLAMFLTCCSDSGDTTPTYTVGGNVTGLSSESLVLDLNNGERITVTADGPFQFTTTLPVGTPYTIKVVDAPASQAPTLTNEIGMVTGTVTNVAVQMSEPRFAVGGTASNVSGTVVVQINGSESLTITGDGPFTFPTRLPDNSAFTITVLQNPTDTVVELTAATGTVVGADVTTVGLDCIGWIHPKSLEDNLNPKATSGGYEPRVAMDAAGNVVIVWQQSSQLYKAEYRDGKWTLPATSADHINPASSHGAAESWIAMDSSGNAIIVWRQYDGTHHQIFKSEYRSGAWTQPADLTDSISPNGQHAYRPRVAMDDNGDAIIAWRQGDGSVDQIFKSEYRSGAWTHPTGLTDNISPAGQYAYDPDVAMDNSGNAIIVWRQRDGSHYQIFKSEYRAGAWTHPASLTDNISPAGQHANESRIAMSAAGALIVWFQSDGSHYQIFKSEYRSGAWTHPANLADNISPDGQGAYQPRVAMDATGNSLIAWRQPDGKTQQIFKSEYRSGAWTHPANLNDNISPDSGSGDQPVVAMDDNGNAIIVWSDRVSGVGQIFKWEYRQGTWATLPTSSPIDLTWNQSYQPEIDMNNAGGAVMVWRTHDGRVDRIFKSLYR